MAGIEPPRPLEESPIYFIADGTGCALIPSAVVLERAGVVFLLPVDHLGVGSMATRPGCAGTRTTMYRPEVSQCFSR